jgi:hypothetical protein
MTHHSQLSRTRRRVGIGLALAAGAAAAAFTMTVTSPLAGADTADLPSLPVPSGPTTPVETLGVQPFFDQTLYQQNFTYTNLLGESIDTSTLSESMQADNYFFPNDIDPNAIAEQIADPNGDEATVPAGYVAGSTFSLIGSSSGFFNIYEDTPVLPLAGGEDIQNIDDAFVYNPSGLADLEGGIGFGIQYLDLPDATTPVDEINLLGSGGDILLSIPVTGDLFSSLF